jgi:hypothetical protein
MEKGSKLNQLCCHALQFRSRLRYHLVRQALALVYSGILQQKPDAKWKPLEDLVR